MNAFATEMAALVRTVVPGDGDGADVDGGPFAVVVDVVVVIVIADVIPDEETLTAP